MLAWIGAIAPVIMIYLVALLAGIGAGLIGAVIGLALFALAFELLRELDRDAVLNSRTVLAGFVFPCAALGFAAGLALVWRWRPSGAGLPTWWKTLTIATLAGAGGAQLMSLADIAGLTAAMFRLIEFGEMLVIFVAASVLALVAGATLAVLAFGRGTSRKARIATIPIAIVGGFAIVMGGLIADKRFTRHYPNLGGNDREALVEIRMSVQVHQGERALRVALHTPTGTTPGRENYWFPEGDHVVMRTRVNMSERTRERVLVVSFDGRPDVTFPLRFPGNPRVMHEYGPWRPLGLDSGLEIRLLTR